MVATAFEKAHEAEILGSLTTIDRLIIHGHIRVFWRRGAFAGFLARQGVRIGDFGSYVRSASGRLIARGKKIAEDAGRPYIYQDRVVRGKDELAREIARRDKITEGLICVLSTVEIANCFALVRGRIVPRLRKCLHLYFYVIDRDLGFMHVRLQTFPFQIQIYLNGREWLARQLDRRGIAYERYENTFLRIEDLPAARRICAAFLRRRWWRLFDALAHRVNPLMPLIRRFGPGYYYWAIDACEVATDIMWKSRRGLLGVLDDLFDFAIRAFSADDVVRFLGYKIQPHKADLASSHKRLPPRADILRDERRRPDCRRIKHRIRRNWIKLYDKWSVLRVETVINRPYDFRVLRIKKDPLGRKRYCYVAMTKGLQNLWRYVQIGEAANRRYLDALAAAKPLQRAILELDALSRACTVDGARYPKINAVAPDQQQVFQAVLAGEHAIRGFRNRELQARLYRTPPNSITVARSRCARVSRIIRKLRGHRLIAKVPGSRLYRVTPRGQRVMALLIRFRQMDFPQAIAA